jgi:hydrogenase maturation protein HypF
MDPTTDTPVEHRVARVRLELRGQVQGVGFRPHVFREAAVCGLSGFVSNDGRGAVIEVEGATNRIEEFVDSVLAKLPPLALVREMRRHGRIPVGQVGFRIAPSERDDPAAADVTPDAATCDDCRRELFDPADRRRRYPFINCVNCGPRYSIIRRVPYDRPATTMAAFTMCDACRREYENPSDRRFHAQPIACPDCGPRVRLLDTLGRPISGDGIAEAARRLAGGAIVAVKGVGGYHLACRADNESVVSKLRRRKLRDGKPLAIMVPNMDAAEGLCRLTDAERAALACAAAPIVLAERRAGAAVAEGVAPRCLKLGLMLPYTPLHHLLFAHRLGPLVMTSANRSAEPLTYRDEEALRELRDIADAFLTHDREIFRPLDDSVVFAFRDDLIPVRRARGYAPSPIQVRRPSSGAAPDILAVGGELKSAFCLLSGDRAILSEHLGDLTCPAAYRHYVAAVDRARELFDFEPALVAHDLHPQYMTTQYARSLGLPTLGVQHHHAHVASLMAEHDQPGPIIGLACDGTGYGVDGAVWGCEILRCERGDFERLGHLEYFPLVGGDLAAIETWRPAAALLRLAYGPDWSDASLEGLSGLRRRFRAAASFDPKLFEAQIRRRVNSPDTASLGRVFDAVAFLLGVCERNRHEAEAAMALENAAAADIQQPYPVQAADDGRLRLAPLVRAIVDDLRAGHPAATVAARFHETLARMLAAAAVRAAHGAGVRVIGLSGGCFLNVRLLERVTELLEAQTLRVLVHHEAPPGDGGIALGQAYVAMWRAAASDIDV